MLDVGSLHCMREFHFNYSCKVKAGHLWIALGSLVFYTEYVGSSDEMLCLLSTQRGEEKIIIESIWNLIKMVRFITL